MKFITQALAITPLLLLALQSPAAAQNTSRTSSSSPLTEAQTKVQQAEEKYAQGNLVGALSDFEAAYALMKGHPAQERVLSNIALCQERLLRIAPAIASYEKYLASLSATDSERETIVKKIEELKGTAGYVKVTVNPGPGAPLPHLTITIDGQVMPAAQTGDEFMLPAGEHQIEMKPEGLDGQTKSVAVVKAEHQELNFELIDPYKEAKERVARAEQLYEAGNYDAALTEFQRAYETMVGHPARAYVIYNIARCQERMYRYDAAVASYKEYLQIAADDEADRPKVEATIESLEGFLGTIVLTISAKKGATLPSYAVWVDGHLVGENIKQFLVPGGNHQVEIKAEGFEGASQEVQVPSRDQKTAAFVLSPLAKEYKGLPKVYFYTATGLTLAAGATGGVFGILAVTERRSIDQKEPEAITEEDADSVKQKALYADIFFISAGVLATSAAILAFLTDWSDERPPPQTGWMIKEVGLAPTHNGGYLSIGGTF